VIDGKYDKAQELFEGTLKQSKDTTTLSLCYRYLANILANPSYKTFDSIESRELRKNDVALSHTFFGESKILRLINSYELWANDEYFLVKNKSEGNRSSITTDEYEQTIFLSYSTFKIIIPYGV